MTSSKYAPPPLGGWLCQPRNLTTLFLVSLSAMGLTRYLAATSDWRWSAANKSDEAIARFLWLHDQVPLLSEWLHREVWITLLGFFWPVLAYLLAHSHSLVHILLQPYILLTGIHLAGWVTAKAILGPGSVVLFELFISVLRVAQLRQLLLSKPCAARYHRESYIQLPLLDGEMEGPSSAPACTDVELRPQASLKIAFAFAIRNPWNVVALLLVELVLWSANVLLLSWHGINLLQAIYILNNP